MLECVACWLMLSYMSCIYSGVIHATVHGGVHQTCNMHLS